MLIKCLGLWVTHAGAGSLQCTERLIKNKQDTTIFWLRDNFSKSVLNRKLLEKKEISLVKSLKNNISSK